MQRFGKYEVVEQIGVGGFGEVFKGFDPDIRRNLAIKTCSSKDETIRSRFQQEAKIAGNLHHPNITTIYDFGIEDDVPYLAQELLTGVDLDRLMDREDGIPLEAKLSYLRQIAAGLGFAHSRGVVHRDVKPANIHILKDGTVKILDFGIARLMHEDIGLTKTGTTVGTAAYLAPEQVQGGELDQRTDIFSFGVLAYELLTLQKPFQGDTFTSVIYKILSEEPIALTELAPECPEEVAEVVALCMAKSPDDRLQSCTEILERLPEGERALTAPIAPVPLLRDSTPGEPLTVDQALPAPADRRRPGFLPPWSWGLGAVVLAALALGIFALVDRPSERQVPELPAAAAQEEETTGNAPDQAPLTATTTTEPEPEVVSPAPPEELPEPALETAPEPAAPPPPPAKGTLTVAAAWSEEMTVSLDGAAPVPLLRDWSFEVDAGPHALLFRLATVEYTAVKEERVQVQPGGELRVESPIAPPGRLSAQPALGTPQALVKVGDDRVGHSPMTAWIDPGTYPLVIEALSGGYDPITLELEVRSGGWTVVTFDLTGRTAPLVESGTTPAE